MSWIVGMLLPYIANATKRMLLALLFTLELYSQTQPSRILHRTVLLEERQFEIESLKKRARTFSNRVDGKYELAILDIYTQSYLSATQRPHHYPRAGAVFEHAKGAARNPFRTARVLVRNKVALLQVRSAAKVQEFVDGTGPRPDELIVGI